MPILLVYLCGIIKTLVSSLVFLHQSLYFLGVTMYARDTRYVLFINYSKTELI